MSLLASIKGRLGEALVASFFQNSRWQVRPFGVEAHLPVGRAAGLSDLSTAANHLRVFPDFLVYDPRSVEIHPYLVEVKTTLDVPSWEDYASFEHVLGVWVSPWGILGQWAGGRATPNPFRRLDELQKPKFELDGADAYHWAAVALHEF